MADRETTTLSPRARLAARLLASGAASTKAEAARAVGLSVFPSEASVEAERLTARIDDTTVATSVLLRQLGREGLLTIAEIMRNGTSETNKLIAARDLADRGPETSKVQRHSVMTANLSSEDIRSLVAALTVSDTLYIKDVPPAELAMVTVDQTPDGASTWLGGNGQATFGALPEPEGADLAPEKP